MVSVSFAGLLSNAESIRASADKWYPRSRTKQPPWTRHGRVHALASSSSRTATCTVTIGFSTCVESAMSADRRVGKTKRATQAHAFACSGDDNTVRIRYNTQIRQPAAFLPGPPVNASGGLHQWSGTVPGASIHARVSRCTRALGRAPKVTGASRWST